MLCAVVVYNADCADVLYVQVGTVDLDICGPSIPQLMAVQGQEVVNSQYGWIPLRSVHEQSSVLLHQKICKISLYSTEL